MGPCNPLGSHTDDKIQAFRYLKSNCNLILKSDSASPEDFLRARDVFLPLREHSGVSDHPLEATGEPLQVSHGYRLDNPCKFNGRSSCLDSLLNPVHGTRFYSPSMLKSDKISSSPSGLKCEDVKSVTWIRPSSSSSVKQSIRSSWVEVYSTATFPFSRTTKRIF